MVYAIRLLILYPDTDVFIIALDWLLQVPRLLAGRNGEGRSSRGQGNVRRQPFRRNAVRDRWRRLLTCREWLGPAKKNGPRDGKETRKDGF